jgi:xanthine dehydrogenase accessory factor
MLRILIRGIGDVGSAVAHCLFRAGHGIVMHDEAKPAHTRRGMSFSDVMFDGHAELEGVLALQVAGAAEIDSLLKSRRAIPVVTEEFPDVAGAMKPDILIDARMRKRAQPECQRHLAPLTIGLGPNFVAGETTHLVIETAWGEQLGAVISHGPSLPFAGEPKPLGGHARDRYVYAPVEGRMVTRLQIGDRVRAGEAVAALGPATLYAPLTGTLRGLTHDGVWVAKGTKIIEVDPRDQDAEVRGLGERPRRIAEGALRALEASRSARSVGSER